MLFAFATIPFFIGTAWSCGTIDMFADSYFGKGPWAGRFPKLDAIFLMGDCAYSYKGIKSDMRMLEVFSHAARNYGELMRVPPRRTGF
jgi:hypothetical protein